MAEGYDNTLKAKIVSTVERLKADDAQKMLFEDVGATGLNHALSSTLVKTLKALEGAVGPLMGDEERVGLTTALTEAVTINKAVSLQSHFREMKLSGNLKVPEIRDLLVVPHQDPLEGEAKVNESAAKSVAPFDATMFTDPSQQDIACEQFLIKIYDLAKQLNLTHDATAALIIRKLAPSTHLLVSHWLEQESVKEAVVKLPILAGLLEQHFMRTSKSPRQANIALQEFNIVLTNAESYYEAAARIARLARLSVKDIGSEKEKELLGTSKALEKYRAILGREDKDAVLMEEKKRAELGQPQLTLLSMQQLLAERADQKKNRREKNNSSFMARKEENYWEEEEEYGEEEYEEDYEEYEEEYAEGNRVYWANNKATGQRERPNLRGAQRNGYRGNQNRGGQRYENRGNYNNRGNNERGNISRENRRGGQREAPRGGNRAWQIDNNRGALRGRGGYRGQQDHYGDRNRGALRSRGQNRERDDQHERPFVTTTMVNVKEGGCLKCNGDHRFTDTSCPYYQRSPLLATPCKKCNIGGHTSSSCLNPRSGNRVNRALMDISEEKDELGEYNDFLESLGGNEDI
jgi:hypothetical protein